MENCNFTLVIPSLDPDEHLPATVTAAIEAGIDDILKGPGMNLRPTCSCSWAP